MEVIDKSDSYDENAHRIYVNKEYTNNIFIKTILKKANERIDLFNISVIYRKLLPKDVLKLPKQNLTFTYVNEILVKLQPPIEELSAVVEQVTTSLELVPTKQQIEPIMSIDEYINLVVDSTEPIYRLHSSNQLV